MAKTLANGLLDRRCLASLPDAGSGVEEMEFNWDEYLEDTGAIAAPHGSFKHVSKGLCHYLPFPTSFFLYIESLGLMS